MERTFKIIVGLLSCVLVGAALFVAFSVFMIRSQSGQFACRSIQSEAKANLSGIFTAEKAFFGEYGVYSTDLNAVNWAPDGAPKYVYGFAVAGGPTKIEGIADLDPSRRTTNDPRVALAADGTERYTTRKMKALDGRPLTIEDLVPGSTVTDRGFVASAAGDIDTDETGVQLDLWTIDETKNLVVVVNDCST